MTYNLFIDDERMPPDDGRNWYIARNINDVTAVIYQSGMPSYISFDHDLGDNEATGYDIAKNIVQNDMDGVWEIPSNFEFYVHSQNPIGKKNIESYLNNYLIHKKG